MKIAFYTLGCKLNFAESSALGKQLIARGHEKVRSGEQADVCIVNTCSVTDTADHKDRQAIHRIRRQHPNAILIVTGCYAQLKPQEVADMPEVDYVLGMDEKFDIPAFVETLEAGQRTKDEGRRTKGSMVLSAEEVGKNPSEGDAMNERLYCYSSEHSYEETPCMASLPVEQKVRSSAIREVDRFCGAVSKDDRTRCFLKVQDGCNYFCTYCTIPLARGKSRNGSIASLVEQAQEAIAGGAKEIVLTGVNIGDFGRTTGETFLDLLKALDSPLQLPRHQTPQKAGAFSGTHGEREYRYRISSCEPNLLTDEIIDFVAQSKHFTPHFHIPLQSGSDAVLKLMKRHYDTALFRNRIEHIKKVMPHAFIGVDVMVGVRGETEEYFNDAVQFIESLDISQLHVFTYSERANTKMLEITPIVPPKERKRRSEVLHALSERKTQAFYAAHKGYRGTVLWESKREGDMMGGFTENYIRVLRAYDKAKINTFEAVEI